MLSAKVAILGASLGGLVAASKLGQLGYDVTVFERGGTVGGLYNKVSTPFGIQELGMHVLYADERHFQHLSEIFGEDAFNRLNGYMVDVGASANFDSVYYDSHYPSLLNHPLRERVLKEILRREQAEEAPRNAMEEAIRRFGPTAAHTIIAPILRKLWLQPPESLSKHALHCFFDLRRLVLCGKEEADHLKLLPELDEVIANPLQLSPLGQVFGGRMGLTFRSEINDISERVTCWAKEFGINLKFGEDVACSDGVLSIGGEAISNDFDACIVAVPVHLMADIASIDPDLVELTINYFQLENDVGHEFPSYYILGHDQRLQASRIVNYASYDKEGRKGLPCVLAIETVHYPGKAPLPKDLVAELGTIIPSAKVNDIYTLPRSVSVFSPTLRNASLLDAFQREITTKFMGKPVYFSGMRTDTGVFFSHHTIGLAYESALACHEQLTSN